MKKFLLVVIFVAIATKLWMDASRRGDDRESVQSLKGLLDRSSLPANARDAMKTLLDQQRLKPSQFDIR